MLQHSHQLHRFSPPLVRRRDDAAFLDRRVPVHRGFDLGGPYFHAGGVDHALEAVGNVKKTVSVAVAEVAGTEELFPAYLAPGFLEGLLVLPVAGQQLRAAHHDFALFSAFQHPEILRIDDQGFGIEGGDAEALLLRVLRRVDMGLRDGLGHAVALDVAHAAEVVELLRDRLGHRRAAAEDPFERGDVVLERLRVRQKVHHHRRHVVPVRALVALDQPRRLQRVPAPLDHHRAAGVDGREEAVDQAGDVEERRRRQGDHVLADVLPGRRAGDVVQNRGVRVHAALRQAGAAGGVGHHGKVVRFCDRGFGFARNDVL